MVKRNDLNEKLNLILNNQNKILKNEAKILGTEEDIESLEKEEDKEENIEIKDEEKALEELSKLEKDIKLNNKDSPLKKITQKDIMKGFVGAFFGVVSHFAFTEGKILSTHLNIYNSTFLYIISFLIINVMLYYTGFRKIEKQILFKFMPLRAITIYLVSILTIIFVYLLFGSITLSISFLDLYKLIAANMIIAIIGAGTADLIGRE